MTKSNSKSSEFWR